MGGGSGAAPDGGAAGGVGDIHPVAEQLGDQLGIGGLAGQREKQDGFAYGLSLDEKPEVAEKFKATTVKGSQFKQPAGTLAASSAVIATGRMTAWGQT